MCGRKKTRSMIDASMRASHDLEKIIYELRKQIDRLNEELQLKELEIKKLQDKQLQYDELGY